MTPNLATEAVWSQLSDDLRRFIRRRVADEHVTDDLLQEAFLRIHQNVGNLNDKDRVAAWVYQIARNVIHDYYRSKKRDAPLEDGDVAEEKKEKEHLAASAALWLDELIRQLPPKYEVAVRLSEISGLRQQEVANRLGLSLSGAKSRIQRGRALLGQQLDQCCTFEFDRRGNLMDCNPKPDRTVCLGCRDLQLP
jgi:RNA polymerase sigma-70 factor (ECF subfamily)